MIHDTCYLDCTSSGSKIEERMWAFPLINITSRCGLSHPHVELFVAAPLFSFDDRNFFLRMRLANKAE